MLVFGWFPWSCVEHMKIKTFVNANEFMLFKIRECQNIKLIFLFLSTLSVKLYETNSISIQ